MDLRTDDFDYELPAELIAQQPVEPRDASRLLILDRARGTIDHAYFRDLPSLLGPRDLLVANRSRVIPARLFGRKASGGRVEILLLRPLGDHRWTALARPGRRLSPGMIVTLDERNQVSLLRQQTDGAWELEFGGEDDPDTAMRRLGALPLPPYIHDHSAPPERYQTVYSDRDGSVAAPTAGLHFTPELLRTLCDRGHGPVYVTLHVGAGTFRPVTADRIADHVMHPEWGEVTADVAAEIEQRRVTGARVVAVGTTTTRLLESAAAQGSLRPFVGETNAFIYPGYRFRAIDALVTNFHLPRSTLLMLVSALAGRELMLEAYRVAVAERYRFYSFGDAMFIR